MNPFGAFDPTKVNLKSVIRSKNNLAEEKEAANSPIEVDKKPSLNIPSYPPPVLNKSTHGENVEKTEELKKS